MKYNRLLCLIILLFVHISIFAQKGMYFGLSSGYGFSIGGSTNADITSYYQSNNSPHYTYTYKNNPINVGQGFLPSLVVGYFFNQNIGAELGIGYLIGTKYNNNYVSVSTYLLDGKAITSNQSNTLTYKLNSLLFNPSLIFKIPTGKWSPYIKMGLLFGVANELTKFVGYQNSGFSKETNTGGLTFGFSSALGLEVLVNKRWGVFSEFTFRYANYTPAKYSISVLHNNNNGTHMIDYTISGNYKDNLNTTVPPNPTNSYTVQDADKPMVNYAANSLGGTIGVRYYLNVEKVSSK